MKHAPPSNTPLSIGNLVNRSNKIRAETPFLSVATDLSFEHCYLLCTVNNRVFGILCHNGSVPCHVVTDGTVLSIDSVWRVHTLCRCNPSPPCGRRCMLMSADHGLRTSCRVYLQSVLLSNVSRHVGFNQLAQV